MPPMKKRKADGAVVVNVDSSAPRRTYKKKTSYARRASTNWRKFSKLKPWADFGAMRYPRGTPEGIGRFGETYAVATPEQRAERANVGWYGNGLYTGDGLYTGSGAYNPAKRFREFSTRALRTLGKGTGKQLNYNLNQQLASLSDPMSMYSGQGLYSSNSLIDAMDSRPSVQFESPNDESQSLVITHKEYVGDVFGPATSAFTVSTYPLNPGLTFVFPFLAQFAQNFDEYELIQMVWEFHSTVDANASTNASGNTGTIIMATNYKADSTPFSNKDEMIQYHGGVSGRLTENLAHGVECDPAKGTSLGQKYVRTSAVAFADIKTYDIGIFNIAFQNVPSTFLNQQVGELWVHYKVKLAKPKLFAALSNNIMKAIFVGPTLCPVDQPIGTPITMLTGLSNSFKPLVSSVGKDSETTNDAFHLSSTSALIPTTAASLVNKKGVKITFPASVNGVFEIIMNAECSVAAASTTGVGAVLQGKLVNSVMTPPNITLYPDMYGASDTLTTTTAAGPNWLTGGQVSTSLAQYRIHIRVASVTNGVDNTIVLYPFGNTATTAVYRQVYVEVTEIGDAFSGSPTNPAPKFINSAGVISILYPDP